VRAYVEEVLTRRRSRIADGIVKLREKGIDVTWEDCARLATGRVISRSHLARVLHAKRYIGRVHRAYDGLLGPDVVPLPYLLAGDAVRETRRLGGISVWAHPGAAQYAEHIDALVAAGLAGVEVHIPRRRPAERRRLAADARSRGLLVTGGSDWHDTPAGPELGRFRVGEDSLAEFLRAAGR
jgi:predicted metal-dependent phosphoesterase TrpH